MANMLSMSAFKISNPIEEIILVKTDNLTRDSGYFCLHRFDIEVEPILRSLRVVSDCTPLVRQFSMGTPAQL
jgi:hypothetical protein